ncbi:hypothetical protein PS15p_206703 [Mucor circinelloides]
MSKNPEMCRFTRSLNYPYPLYGIAFNLDRHYISGALDALADDAQALECMKPPAILTLSSKQLDQGAGLNAHNKSLQRKKKLRGRQITTVESILSSNSLCNSCNTPDKLQKSVNILRDCPDVVRSCYHSSNQ